MSARASLPYFSLPTMILDFDTVEEPRLLSPIVTRVSPDSGHSPCYESVSTRDSSIDEDADELELIDAEEQHPPEYATYEDPLPQLYPLPHIHASPHRCAHDGCAPSPAQGYSYGNDSPVHSPGCPHLHAFQTYRPQLMHPAPMRADYAYLSQLAAPPAQGCSHHQGIDIQQYQPLLHNHAHSMCPHTHTAYTHPNMPYCVASPSCWPNQLRPFVHTTVPDPTDERDSTKPFRLSLQNALKRFKESVTTTADKVFRSTLRLKNQKLPECNGDNPCEQCSHLEHGEQFNSPNDWESGTHTACECIPGDFFPSGEPYYSNDDAEEYDQFTNPIGDTEYYEEEYGEEEEEGMNTSYVNYYDSHSHSLYPQSTATTANIARTRKQICECRPCMKALAIKIVKRSRAGRRKYRRVINSRYRRVAAFKISRLNALATPVSS